MIEVPDDLCREVNLSPLMLEDGAVLVPGLVEYFGWGFRTLLS